MDIKILCVMLVSYVVQKILRVSSYCFLVESCDNRDLYFESWRSTIDYNTSQSQEIPAILTILQVEEKEASCFFETSTPRAGQVLD